jgi:Tfp pilus assembly protein PilP
VPELNVLSSTIAMVDAIEQDGSINISIPSGRTFRVKENEFGLLEKVESKKGEWIQEYKDIDVNKQNLNIV